MNRIAVFFYCNLILLPFFLSSCFKGDNVDLIVHNARIFTMNEKNDIMDAMAINDGKIIQVGPEREILNRYRGKKEVNGAQKPFYPSFIDVNSSLLWEAKSSAHVNAATFETVYKLLLQLEKHYGKHQPNVSVAFNFSLDSWGENEQRLLEERFNNQPVIIFNQTYAAAATNSSFDKKMNIQKELNLITHTSQLNTILAAIPKPTSSEFNQAIINVQEELLAHGYQEIILNAVNFDDFNTLLALDERQQIKLPIHLFATCDSVFLDYIKNNPIEHKNINILGFYLEENDINKQNYAPFLTATLENDWKIRVPGKCLNQDVFFEELSRLLPSHPDHRWQVLLDTVSTMQIKRIKALNLLPIFTPQTFMASEDANELSHSFYLIGNHSYFSSNSPFELAQHLSTHLTVHIHNQKTPLFKHADILKGLTTWGSYGIKKESQLGTLEKGKKAGFNQLVQPFEIHSTNRPNYVMERF